jgi:hypothetical protein
MNVLENDIKSLSLDTIKLQDIFNKYNNVDIEMIHNNYKNNIFFKKFISLSIKLNSKIFKYIDGKYILKDNIELLNYCKKLRKILLKKYAINIFKYLLEDHNNIIDQIYIDLEKLKKYFIYIEMYEYILKNVYITSEQLAILCFKSIKDKEYNTIKDNKYNEIIGNLTIGRLECISTNSTEISFDSNIQINLSPYINYKKIESNNVDLSLTQSKGKVINISLKNYIAEYSN